ncbi:MAG: 4Fe-4S binding protein [Anaerolineae bacterium]|nr:4Fe-4S binding protein [Anaerolineae bacterium]
MQKFWLRLARRRGIVQLLAALLTNSYFTERFTKGLPCPSLNCYACPAAAFACPIGSLQHLIGRHKAPLYVLGVVGLVGALIGRASCGWFCPFGWFQELAYKLPVPKLRLPNRFNWTRYVVLIGLVGIVPLITRSPWFCKLCPAGTLEAGIPMVLVSADIRALVGSLYWLKVGILVLFLAWMSVTRRPFCRWVCPLGALWSPLNPISSLRLAVDVERCTQCNRCQEVCPVDIRVYDDPNSGACIRCLACARVCPTHCISVTS